VEAFYRLRPGWGKGKSADPSAIYYRVKFDPSVMRSTAFPAAFGSSFSGGLVLPSLNAHAESTLSGLSFWPRAAARGIDYVVQYLLGMIAGLIFGVLLGIAAGGRPPLWVLIRMSQMSFTLFLAGLFGGFAYHVICVSISGRTLGKFLLSMQVVQDDGSSCRAKSSILRELGYYVPDGLFFGILGYISMKNDSRRKRHGDDWADTMVCKRADLPARTKQDGATRFLLGFMIGSFANIAIMMLGLLIHVNS